MFPVSVCQLEASSVKIISLGICMTQFHNSCIKVVRTRKLCRHLYLFFIWCERPESLWLHSWIKSYKSSNAVWDPCFLQMNSKVKREVIYIGYIYVMPGGLHFIIIISYSCFYLISFSLRVRIIFCCRRQIL